MCGITFILDKSSVSSSKDVIERSNVALSHRGPDDSSQHLFENVGLGHTRLSIVDISGGRQPFFSEDEKVVLICNGEIYNHRELREALISKGYKFRSNCDCEVILHLYEQEPDTYIRKLDGMFAFVILDKKKRCVHIGRDRVGIKPLYYYDGRDYIICSSEIKGILGTNLVNKELDPRSIFDGLIFGYIPGETTAFRNIKNFPPANMAVCDLASPSLKFKEYWQPSFLPAKEQGLFAYGRSVKGLGDVVSDAMRSHTIGDVPISAYLSGGIDSTITTFGLKRCLEEQSKLDSGKLKVFSIKFEDREWDESDIFLKTIELGRLDSHILEAREEGIETFKKVIYHIEQPQTSFLDIPLFLLSKLVREQGRKVIYSGEGADELFGGYSCYTLNQARRALSMKGLEALRDTLMDKVLKYFLHSPEVVSSFSNIYKSGASEIIDRFGTYPAWYPFWKIKSDLMKDVFKDRQVDSLGDGGIMHSISEKIKSDYADISDYDKSIYLELKTRLPNYILSRADKNSMANSVELRVPFLDNNVIDFGLMIPPIYKMFGLKEKFLLRRTFKSTIPKHVLKRSKFGYNAPYHWILRRKGGLEPLTKELLSESYIDKVGIFNSEKVTGFLKEILSKRDTHETHRSINISQILIGVLSTHILYANFAE